MARTAKQQLATGALEEVFSSYVPVLAVAGALNALDKMGAFHVLGIGGDPSKVNLVKPTWSGDMWTTVRNAQTDPRMIAAKPLNAAFQRWSKGKKNEAAQRALVVEMAKFRAAGFSISPQIDEVVDGLTAYAELPPVDVAPPAPYVEEAAPALWMDREAAPRLNLQPAMPPSPRGPGGAVTVKVVAPGVLGQVEPDGVKGAGLVLLLVAAVLLVLLAAG